MKRILTLIFTLTLMIPSSAQAQDNSDNVDCPDGHVCITEEEASDLREIVNHRKCMKNALEEGNEDLQYELDPFTIVVTKEDQVFIQDKLIAKLKWCDYDVQFESDPNFTVHMKEEEDGIDWGFELRPRVRLGFLFHPLDIPDTSDFRSLFEPSLLFEPFHIGLLHPEAHVGLKSFGLGAGVDITRNLDFYVGAASKWREPLPVQPVTGFSLSFN